MKKIWHERTKLWRRGLAMLLALVGAIAFSACSGTMLKGSAAQVPQVVLSILSDPKTFNYVLNAESPNIFGLTYEGLLRENPLTGAIEPRLAKSWEISPDKLRITFTLREGLKWSDGQPLTINDVVFSYNKLFLNEEIPTNVRDSLRIGQSGKFPIVRKVDNQRVEFIFPEPFSPFVGATGLGILPAHALGKFVTEKDSEGKPIFLSKWGVDTPPNEIIVNGPYKLKSYATSQRVVFERNPYFWRKDAQGNALPYIQEVVWEIVENQDTSLLQFRSGDLDAIGISPEYYSLLKREEKRGKFTIYNGGPSYGTNFVFFNLNRGSRDGKPLVDPIKSRWFNNVKFRQAVAYAIDYQQMINNVFRGLGAPQKSPISVQSPFYDDTLKGYSYNPDKARSLLKEAGFKYNDRGQLLDDRGNRVRFVLATNAGNKTRESMMTQIVQNLAQIGIQVDPNPLAFNVVVDKLSNSLDWDCVLLGLTGGNEPNDGANVWFPEGNLHMFNQKPQPGEKEIESWEAADWERQIQQLYIQAAAEFDLAKRKALYAQTQQITEEYLPFIYLVNSLSLSAVRDRIQPIQYSALEGALWNIEELKIVE
ncbi:ABC transporter substrate-binding protein [Oscillatoria sp. FACHB-1406]|uniref:ABC transporter substrate-binding protein n=1 Tax=Oscillatoria sp. FACHB-1406 TaxID=2692846 RepID=UPI0016854E17|nr:ABC transporter substrate-binding protein [Oscillatoria sp. FACHB-1406]MBD2578123.1 ABC transporter substrate-binding protein [Oscillatoria sp. FACHB-1406]